MQCLHPHCPLGNGLSSWADVLDRTELRVRAGDRPSFLAALGACGALSGAVHVPPEILSTAGFKRILRACPCLYAQVSVKTTARAVVHLCEVTLGAPIDSSNVFDAFKIQHPNSARSFLHPPIIPGANGGEIMEALCSEVLTNHGVPHMAEDADGWPDWGACCHVSLNTGKLRQLKLYGDILIPCAPHNILISVKSEKARERFVVSGNRLESVGFGFFDEPDEFWTTTRMNMYKRWGFSAIYMPEITLSAIKSHLAGLGTSGHAININGTELFRPLEDFGRDIARIAGKVSLAI